MMPLLLTMLHCAQAQASPQTAAPAPPAPTINEAHCGKSGTTIFISGVTQLAPVVTAPTLMVNNISATLIPGPVSGGFWSFSLPPGMTINPSDTLNLSLVDGWVARGTAVVLPVRNSAGSVEFPVPAPAQRTMQLGVCITNLPLIPYMPYCPVKNWAVRLGGWAGASGFNAAGDVVKINGRLATAGVLSYAAKNSIDKQNIPSLQGNYTLVYDSPDPATMLDLHRFAGDTIVTPQPGLSSPGTNGVGITKVFSVTSVQNSPQISLAIVHPQGAPQYSNLWIIPPGNTLDRSNRLATEANVLRDLTIGGGRGPTVIRPMAAAIGWGGNSNQVAVTDLVSPAPTSWLNQDHTFKANITTIRPVDLTQGVQIITANGPIPVTDLKPWFYGARWIAEVVTDAPHGFTTGQVATISLPTIPTFVTGGITQTLWPSFGAQVWVTGPQSFITIGWGNPALPGAGITPLDTAVNPVGATVSVNTTTGPILPWEFFAAMAGNWPGTTLWVTVPMMASDAMIDEMATRILAALPTGNKIGVELCNEVWNSGNPHFWYARTMAALMGVQGKYPMAVWFASRTNDVANRFKAVFAAAGRPNDVLSILQWQLNNLNVMVQSVITAGVAPADVIGVAPYFDVPKTWATAMDAWTSEQVHDLFRHYLVLDPGAIGLWTDFTKSVAAYEQYAGHRVQRWTYEGGVERLIPQACTNITPRTLDANSHPDAYLTEHLLFAQAQAAGMDVFSYFSYQNPVGSPYGSGVSWGLWNWQGQIAGRGDNSDGRGVNPQTGTSGVWNPYLAVRGHAWRDWQRDALMGSTNGPNGPVVPPTPVVPPVPVVPNAPARSAVN